MSESSKVYIVMECPGGPEEIIRGVFSSLELARAFVQGVRPGELFCVYSAAVDAGWGSVEVAWHGFGGQSNAD